MGKAETAGASKTSAVNTIVQLYNEYTKVNLEFMIPRFVLAIKDVPDNIVLDSLSKYKIKCQKNIKDKLRVPHPQYFITICINEYAKRIVNKESDRPDDNDDGNPPLTLGKLIW